MPLGCSQRALKGFGVKRPVKSRRSPSAATIQKAGREEVAHGKPSADPLSEVEASPSITEHELWAVAHYYVSKFGEGGWLNALFRAEELSQRGDTKGCETYLKILNRIERLLAIEDGTKH